VNGGRERRLEVMHDPRIGALSAAFLFLFLLLKIFFFYRCMEAGVGLWALPVAAIWGRAPLAWELWRGPPAQPGKGLYAGLHSEMRGIDVGLSFLLGLVVTAPFGMMLPMWSLGLGVGGALVGSLIWHRRWRDQIGGLSGDVLGAAVELRELLFLAIFASLENHA
jgi:adenosylcobinamide-GDP ribazoletransferase